MTALPESSYVSLTTFRLSGVPVSTPVWAAPDGDSLIVWTRSDSGKVKRLKHTTRVSCAPCDFRGRVRGPAVDGVAEFVAHAEWPDALAALRSDYGWQFRLGYVTSRLVQRLSRSDTDRNEIIRIRPTT